MNTSTEFLISFDAAEDTKSEMADQHGNCSSAVAVKDATDVGVTIANEQPVASEQIQCEFFDNNSCLFPFRDSGAGEAVNSDDVWLSIASFNDHPECAIGPAVNEESAEVNATRKVDYIKHSVDFSPDFTTANDIASEASAETVIGTAETTFKTSVTDWPQNESIPSTTTADHQFTDNFEPMKQNSDICSDFAVISDILIGNGDSSEKLQATEGANRKVDDADRNQCAQLFELVPDSNITEQQFAGGQQVLVPESVTFQLIECNHEATQKKVEIETSLPVVHRSTVPQGPGAEFPDKFFFDEPSPNTTARNSEAAHPADAIEEIQVNLLNPHVISLLIICCTS